MLLISACYYFKPADVPMTGEYFHFGETNEALVVLLHGQSALPLEQLFPSSTASITLAIVSSLLYANNK